MRMLQTHAPAIFLIFVIIVFILFFAFSTVHANTVSMRFRFDPLSRAFSNRCVFDENALRISVDERLKRTEMY